MNDAMKKLLFSCSLLLAISFASCSQDESQELPLLGDQVTGIIADAAATRTSLGDGGKVIWLANDDISLISNFCISHCTTMVSRYVILLNVVI